MAVKFKVVTGGGGSVNTEEIIESGLELNAKVTQLHSNPGYNMLGFSTEWHSVRRKGWELVMGLTLPPARRVPLRQGVAAQDRGGQGTSCPTKICGRLTSHGRQIAALASTSCFWGCSSCWGSSVSPPLAYEEQQKKEVESGASCPSLRPELLKAGEDHEESKC